MASRLAPLGFRAETLVCERRHERLAAPGNARARSCASPATPTSCRPARVPEWQSDPFVPDRARRLALRPGRRRHERLARRVRHGDRGVRRGASATPPARSPSSLTSDEEGPSVDGTVKVVEKLAAAGETHRLLHRRRADVGRSARRHDQERPARHAVRHADRQGRPGPCRLSAARAESDPSRRARARGARRDAMGRRQRLFPADDMAVLQHPCRHRRDQRHSRRARS